MLARKVIGIERVEVPASGARDAVAVHCRKIKIIAGDANVGYTPGAP
jgi:hypothetical protein